VVEKVLLADQPTQQFVKPVKREDLQHYSTSLCLHADSAKHGVYSPAPLLLPQVVEKVLLADQPTKQVVEPEDLAVMVLQYLAYACGCV
jgi:hypothetical protein